MNEVELIRGQLTLEKQHAAEVARACASALAAAGSSGIERLASLEAFRQAGVEYLVWMLSRFEEREQVFHDLLRGRFPAEDPDRSAAEGIPRSAAPGATWDNRRAVETALALPGTSREALAKLETALGVTVDSDSAAGRWTDFLRFFSGAWSARRDEIDRLFERQAKVADWRTVSDIDADSIVDERSRYARVKATLPDGIDMSPTASHL